MTQRIGKYEIIEEIGRGATSTVYRAMDPFAGREVAIKMVCTEILQDPVHGRRFRKLFLTEASLAGKLGHPHIASIYDAVSDDEMSYLVMEYVPGGTLEAHTRPEHLLPIATVVEIVFKCCKALDHAYRHGVIHRDIKPANILLAQGTDIKISDFGAALTAAQDTTQVTGIGSPAYMSPEQVQEREVSQQTDIFSLGVVLYQLLSGALPFKATNNYSMIFQIINVDPPPPSLYRPEIPAALDAITKRALAKRIEDRYPTWEAFAQDLVRAFQSLRMPQHALPDSEKFDTLRRLAFFARFSDVDLWQVVHIAQWKRFAASAHIIREGERGTGFFILASGEVDVSRSQQLLSVLNAGECFGEMAYVRRRNFRRSASVTARCAVMVIEIAEGALDAANDSCRHQFTAAFLDLLIHRLDAADVRLSELLERNPVA